MLVNPNIAVNNECSRWITHSEDLVWIVELASAEGMSFNL